ncbi:DNA repair protein RadA [Rhodococcus sp. X156]|uniref:DNA repair protein RadA n=1 Tax=Rhodococcus sp. X156 TaxID=2499145 RepID=UPI000FD7BB99|nr:DNA repair protein RadA [Rhodococcus sp. X156]
MAKPRSTFRCAQCAHTLSKWVGRCPECGEWGSIAEAPALTSVGGRSSATALVPATPAVPMTEVDLQTATVRPTGVAELDRVLGGGMVPGAVVLLAGEPGVGKSTLLLEVVRQWAPGSKALYVTGEESAAQVRLRAERTDAVHPEVYLAAETDLATVLSHVDQVQPELLIVDSVQTMYAADVDGVPGGVTQVRAITAALTSLAKARGLPIILVGHVTKDGAVAGPRSLEHLVDVVLHFEGDKHSTLRMVRGVKNRFGAADEVGCFELRADGIHGVSDPSGLFLHHQGAAVPGTAVTVAVEGKRPLLCEVQALVAPSSQATPRRAVSGLDSSRVAMILAVLERRGGVKVSDAEVYTATVGGMRVTEPAADLALALAVASAASDRALPSNLVVIGELGLAGEVRRVAGTDRRVTEARRLGFTHALVPPDSGPMPPGVRTTVVADIPSALRVLFG